MDLATVIAAISAFIAVVTVAVSWWYGRRQSSIAAGAKDTAEQALANARTLTAMTVRQTALAEKANDDADAPKFNLGQLELREHGWTLPLSMARGPRCALEIRADVEYQSPLEGFETDTRFIVQGGDFWLEWFDDNWVPGSAIDLELDISRHRFPGTEIRVDAVISVTAKGSDSEGRRWPDWVEKRTWMAP